MTTVLSPKLHVVVIIAQAEKALQGNDGGLAELQAIMVDWEACSEDDRAGLTALSERVHALVRGARR